MGPSKIVSRTSLVDGSEGTHSFGMEQGLGSLVMYYTSKNSPIPMLYYKCDHLGDGS